MSGGCFYDIHENLFLPLFILLFLYFLEKENLKGSIISLILLLGVKEDAAVYACLLYTSSDRTAAFIKRR